MLNTQLQCRAGETATFSLTARLLTHSLRTLSGMTVSFRVIDPDHRSVSKLTVAGSITDASAGTYSVTLTASQTEGLVGDYDWISYATSGSTIYGIGQGKLRVHRGVSA